MAAPSYVEASSGLYDAGGTWTFAIPISLSMPTIAAGDLIILDILQDGTTAGALAITSIASNLVALDGTAGALTTIGTDLIVGSPTAARRHLFVGRWDGVGSQFTINGTNSTSEDLFGRAYAFRGAHTGPNLSDVLENTAAGNVGGIYVLNTNTISTIAQAEITTTGPDRLLCQFVAQNDDNALGSFSGGSGATWTETLEGEYADATGTDGVIQLQTATKATAGTSTGANMASVDATDGWSCVGFAIKPPVSGSALTATPSDTITLTDASVRAPVKKPADTITLTDSLSRVWAALKPLADTLTLTDAAGKTVAHPLADALTLTDGTTRVAGKGIQLADVITLADARVAAYGLPKADSLTLADSLTRAWVAALSRADSITLTDARVSSAGKRPADTLTLTDAAAKAPKMTKADSVTLTDAAGKAPRLAKADSVTLTDATANKPTLAKADTLTLADSATKALVLTKADAVTLTDAQVKGLQQLLADLLALADNITPVLTPGSGGLTKSLADVLTLADAVAKTLAMNRQDTFTLTDVIARSIVASHTDTLTLTDARGKTVGKSCSDLIPLSDSVAKAMGMRPGDSISLADAINIVGGSIHWALNLADTVALADDLARALNGEFQGQGDVVRTILLNRFGIY